MMTFDIMVLAAAAISTVVILFSVVILGNIQDYRGTSAQRGSSRH